MDEQKIVVTQEVLDSHPHLAEQGIEVGAEINASALDENQADTEAAPEEDVAAAPEEDAPAE